MHRRRGKLVHHPVRGGVVAAAWRLIHAIPPHGAQTLLDICKLKNFIYFVNCRCAHKMGINCVVTCIYKCAPLTFRVQFDIEWNHRRLISEIESLGALSNLRSSLSLASIGPTADWDTESLGRGRIPGLCEDRLCLESWNKPFLPHSPPPPQMEPKGALFKISAIIKGNKNKKAMT